MPAFTRNMKKNFSSVEQVKSVEQTNPVQVGLVHPCITIMQPQRTPEETAFINTTKDLLAQCQAAQGKQARMKIALQIYKNVNEKLTTFLAQNPNLWNKFAATVYNKAIEFEQQYKNNDYINEVDASLHIEFESEFSRTINFLENYLGSQIGYFALLSLLSSNNNDPLNEALQTIEKRKLEKANARPRRNIQRINYAGMDTIEPESGFDGITDIWFDESQFYDTDYVFEEDEEDDDAIFEAEFGNDEELNPCDSAMKLYGMFVERALNESFQTRKSSRNVQPVNYSGMDMNSDDEGEISICKTKWNNGVPSYSWVKYPAAQANEIGDEEYCCEY